jgi:hypothetical protein
MQNQVTVLDAVSIIRLMEASWGFGRLISADHLIRHEMPLGPNQQQTAQILNLLQLSNLNFSIPAEQFDNLYKPKRDSQDKITVSQPRTQKRMEISLAGAFSDHTSDEDSDGGGRTRIPFRDTVFPDNLDELLRLDNDDDLKVTLNLSDEDEPAAGGDVKPTPSEVDVHETAKDDVQETATTSSVVSMLHGRFAFSQVNQKKLIKSSNTAATKSKSSPLFIMPSKRSKANISPISLVSQTDEPLEDSENMNNILNSIKNSCNESDQSLEVSPKKSPIQTKQSPSKTVATSLIRSKTVEKLNRFCFVENSSEDSATQEERLAGGDPTNTTHRTEPPTDDDEEELDLDVDNLTFNFD